MTDAAVDAGMGRPVLTAAGVIIVLTGASYCNALTGVFLFDDYHQILMNPHIRRLADLPGLFTSGSGASLYSNLKGYRPLTMASFGINYALSGYRVFGYHLFNLMLHMANALLVYLVVGAVLARAGHKETSHTALFAATAFALHPVGTSAVTYVSGRAALLATFFYLSSFYFFVLFRTREVGVKTLLGAASVCLYVLGLLSKEMAVSLPVTAAVYDLVFASKGGLGPGRRSRTYLYYLCLLFAAAAYLAARKAATGYTVISDEPHTPVVYLMSELKALILYLRLLLLPTGLSVDHNMQPTTSPDVLVAASALLVAAVLYTLFKARLRYPDVSFFGLWFFITLAPESTVVPITDIAVEYRLYLPAAGFIAALVITMSYGMAAAPSAAKKAAAAAVLCLFCILTYERNSVWATERSLWEDACRKAPSSTRPYLNLQMALVHEKKYAEAAAMESVLLRPEAAMNGMERAFVLNHTGFALMMMGNPAEAMGKFEQAAREDPGLYDSYEYMGLALMAMGRDMEASVAFRKAIEIVPGFADAHTNLSLAFGRMKMDDQALAEAREAVRLEPKDFECNYNLAIALYNIGRRADAHEQALVTEGLAGGPKERAKAEALLSSVRQ